MTSILADGITDSSCLNNFGLIFGIMTAADRRVLLNNNEEVVLSVKFS